MRDAIIRKSNERVKKEKRLLSQEELWDEVDKIDETEEKLNKAFHSISDKVSSNQMNKCWNSVNLSLKADVLNNIVRRKRLRIS